MNTSEKPQLTRPNCLSCRHFYITYEPAHPYGCRAMNFKAKEMPGMVVFSNSGIPCQAFTAKEMAG